jgi:hypothetical protein
MLNQERILELHSPRVRLPECRLSLRRSRRLFRSC